MRIDKHPILNFRRGEKLSFFFNGKEMEGYSGETVAAALHAAGIRELLKSPNLHRPRGLFCADIEEEGAYDENVKLTLCLCSSQLFLKQRSNNFRRSLPGGYCFCIKNFRGFFVNPNNLKTLARKKSCSIRA